MAKVELCLLLRYMCNSLFSTKLRCIYLGAIEFLPGLVWVSLQICMSDLQFSSIALKRREFLEFLGAYAVLYFCIVGTEDQSKDL